MTREKYLMNLNETLVLRGISILFIVLHNFVHWLPGAIVENQHAFYPERNYELVDSILNFSPDLLLDLISHYGHYGVPVFVFLSGYGLVMKYEKAGAQLRFGDYMKQHLVKLWLLLLPILILHFILLGIKDPAYFQEHWSDLLLMVGFASNLNPDFYFFHGPWWFFSLIAQLYLIYYTFVYQHTLKPIIILTVVCLLGQIVALSIPMDVHILEYIRHNFAGSVLPFTLGVSFARRKYFPTKRIAITAFILFVISCFNAYLWTLTFGLIAIAILPFAKVIRSSLNLYLLFKWLGVLSAFLFVTHPIIRAFTFGISKHPLILSLIGYITLSILLAWGYKKMISWGKQQVLSIK